MFHSNLAVRGRTRRGPPPEQLDGKPYEPYKVQGWIGGSSVQRTVQARSEREAYHKAMGIFSNNSDISVAKQ